MISTAESLPRKRAELVVHHDEDNPTQVEAHAPSGGEIVVTIVDEKRRGGKERQWGQRSDREWERVGNCETRKSLLRTASPLSDPLSTHSQSLRLLEASPSLSPKGPTEERVDANESTPTTQDVGWGDEPIYEGNTDVSPNIDSGGGGWDGGEEGVNESGEWNCGEDWNEEKQEDAREDEWNISTSKNHSCEQSQNRGSPRVEDWGRTDDINSATYEQRQRAQNVENIGTICDTSAQVTGDQPSQWALRSRLLDGKIAAITGASRGIGRAIALGFAREGAHIIAHYWGTNTDPAGDDITSLSTEIRGMGQQCIVITGDISDPETSHNIVQKAVEGFGKLDIGVGNAGICSFCDVWDIKPELMQRHLDVNINGNLWFVQACARQMKSQYLTATKSALDEDHWNREGELGGDIPDHSLLLISSTTSMTASPAAAHYAACGAAISSLVQSIAVDLGKYGIRCNALLPGTVMTRMVKEGMVDLESSRALERRAPLLSKMGRPRDIVGPAVFLAGEQSRYVTGTKLVVDGGAAAAGGGGW